MACLEQETIAGFIDGRLASAELAHVEAHVRICTACEALLFAGLAVQYRRSMSERGKPREAAPAAAPAVLSPGTAVGRYLLIGSIGRGGMGQVYAAYDPKLDRKVALKFLRDRRSAEASRNEIRLLREAQATARLAHPNVVGVYDVGSFQDQVFVAMQYVDGRTLSAWLREKPRSRSEIIGVFVDAARGLAAAHQVGFVHRDFKPSNVMVGRDGIARVMDFGLARRIDAPSEPPDDVPGDHLPEGTDLSLTYTGELVGTPLYMAPEQLKGTAATALSDQFSFCVALYEALSGQHPLFDQTHPDHLRKALLVGRVRPLPASAVPTRLRQVLLRGLSIDPERRFPSMQALLAELTPRPARSRWRWAAAGALAAVGAIALTRHPSSNHVPLCRAGDDQIAHVWDARPGGSRRAAIHRAFTATGHPDAEPIWTRLSAILDDYSRNWVSMYTDACEATHIRGDQSAQVLDLRMVCLERPTQALGALTGLLEHADKKTVDEAIAAALALPPIARCANVPLLKAAGPPPSDARVRANVANLEQSVADVRALTDVGKWTEAETRVGALADQALATGYDFVMADVLSARGWLEDQSGREQAAARTLERGIWSAVAAGRDDLAAEMAAELVGVTGYRLGRLDEAERWKEFTDSFLRRLGPGQERTEAWLAHDWALALQREGRHEEAVGSIRRAITLKTRVLPKDHPDIAISLMAFAELLSAGGDYEEALRQVEAALGIFGRTYGPHSVPATYAIGIRGEVLEGLGRYQQAEKDDRECFRLRQQIEPDSSWVAYPLTALGRVLMDEARFPEAVAALERALRIREGSEHNPELVAETEFALARALRAAGQDHGRARLLAQRALTAYRGLPGHSKQVSQIDRWLTRATDTG